MKLKLLLLIILISNCGRKEKNILEIPDHQIFTPRLIDFQLFPENYEEKIDTLLILTNENLIALKCEYAIQDGDTVIAAYMVNGIFGFEYHIYENSTGTKESFHIEYHGKDFEKNEGVNFQWWDKLLPNLKKEQGIIIISGP